MTMRCLIRPRLVALASLLCAVAACVWPVAPGHAAAYTYSTQQRTIHAGILLIDSTAFPDGSGVAETNSNGELLGPDAPAPYVFYILSQRSDLKPFGWNFDNPLAPKSVTGDIQQRWDAHTSTSAQGSAFRANLGGHVYQLGQAITPYMAPYWEVYLSKASSDDLSQFDILYLHIRGHTARFRPEDVEKLRRFVDGGGQLWIEDCGGGRIDPANPLFFALNFNNGARGFAVLPLAPTGKAVRHPIIATPYFLSPEELNTLGDKYTSFNYYSSDFGGTLPPGPGLLSVVLGNSANLDANKNPMPVIAAGQYGAGQVIVTSQDSGDAINDDCGGIQTADGGNTGPYCGYDLEMAKTQDLKLVYNMLTWAGTHPHEHKNSHQNGSDQNSTTTSYTPTWAYPASGPAPILSGAAIDGDKVYVRDAAGNIDAFDAYPAEDLDGDGNPDDGIQDFSGGTPYDMIWQAAEADPAGSAPTLGFDKNTPVVFTERASGAVEEINAETGAVAALPGSGAGGLAYGSAGIPTPAPAPTYYDGRVFAGEPDGTLYVYDLAAAKSATIFPERNAPNAEYVDAPPTVGILNEDGANDIIAFVSTNRRLHTVFVGARRETINNGAVVKMGRIGPQPPKSFMYTVAPRLPSVYYDDANGYRTAAPGLTANPNPPSFSFTPIANVSTYFGDYDADFAAAAAANSTAYGDFTRSTVAATSTALIGTDNIVISAPALDRSGNVYFTVTDITKGDSSLCCYHDSPNAGTAYLRWRFRLPTASDGSFTDADNVSYANLMGYVFASSPSAGVINFVSTPVVDNDGLVYATATNGKSTAVLSFNGLQDVTAGIFDAGQSPLQGVSGVTISQPIGGTGQDEFGASPSQLAGSQFSADRQGNITFRSFAPPARDETPNLSEPQPITVAYTFNGASAGPITRPVHTNLIWYTIYSQPTGIPTSLTLTGSYLYFGANTISLSGASLYKVYARPQQDGMVQADKTVNPAALNRTGTQMVTSINSGLPNNGPVTAVPSASNGVLVVNGPTGVGALANRYTLVADNNRLIELDGDGNAAWAVDSTALTTVEGGDEPVSDQPAGPTPATGQLVTTHLALNRPTSVTQLSSNDYLVADTGNNRCVRLDRAGKVLWEVTKFNDGPIVDPNTNAALPIYVNPSTGAVLGGKTAALLSPGEPDTLDQPTSVQTWVTTPPYNGGTLTVVHYLIADTGNYRVLEVDDIYDNKGNAYGKQHNLVWISHTRDKQGRNYRYQSASYLYYGPTKQAYVAALVTNTRIPMALPTTNPTDGSLPPANADAAGGSIVLINYNPGGAAAPPDGYISNVLTEFKSYGRAVGAAPNQKVFFNLTAAMSDPTGAGANMTVQLRNPRFLLPYSPAAQNPNNPQDFLIADDNGVYDLQFRPGNGYVARWGMTQDDYRTIELPLGSVNGGLSNIFNPILLGTNPGPPPIPIYGSGRAGQNGIGPVPFMPSSIQRVGTDLPLGTSGPQVGRYLISNTFSQGEVLNPINSLLGSVPGFGGEAFETTTLNIGGVLNTIALGEAATVLDANGIPVRTSFSGQTLGRPANTGALTQPTYAVQVK